MKRKALMRRVLSGILCAALVFQNTSVTALATQAPSEMLTEISENANEELSTEELSVSESETKLMTESSEESLSEDSSLKESSSAVETETQQLEESITEDLLSAVEGETQVVTEPSSTEESSSAESETQSQETSSENDTIAEIKIDEDELHLLAISEDVGLDFDLDTNTIIAQYSKDNNVFNKITDAIKTSQTIITIDTDDTNYTNLKEHLDFKWQSKNADNTYKYMAAGEAPNNVGEYRLVISLDQRFGKSQPVSINFEIIKIVLQADTSEFNVKKKSGITVKEIKDELTDVLKIKDSDENKLDWDTYIKSYTITVKEITGTEALADDAVLKKGTDYSAEITAELADEFISGYELKKINTVYLKVYELKETDITITSFVGNNITRVYDGNPISEPVVTSAQEGITPEITAEITVVGETDEATGKDKVLEVPYESLIKSWYDADGTKRETVPVDAGIYYFELKYTDSEGIYDESSAQIKVEVEPKTIVLNPSIAVTEFLVGNTATDVTSNVVYTLINTDDSVFEGWDKNTFFGVSYNNPEKPQSYAPVFSLQMGVTTKPEEGQETVTVWSDVTGEIVTPTGTDKEGTKTEYRIVFSGKKGLFTDNVATDLIDINATYVNSADKNYNIDTTEETIQKLAIAINVKESVNAVIDITAMLPEGVEAEAISSDVNIYKKIYDRNSFYADRAAYKKAIVKDENGVEIAKETADAITYTWYHASFYEYTDEAGNEACEAVLGAVVETVYNGLPSNAGTYALEVEYTDPEHKYIADKAYLYFEIEKQLIKFVPDKDIAFDVYEGATVGSFINSIPFDLQYKFYKYPSNDVTLANEQLIELTELSSENYPYPENNNWFYGIEWFVLSGDNTDKAIANYERVYSKYEEFKLNVPYKLGAQVVFLDEAYEYNYADNYQVIIDDKFVDVWTCDTLDINVKPQAETEILIDFDASKLTKEMLEKVYDGKSFDISEAVANGFVIVTDTKSGKEIPVTGENAIELSYVWVDDDSYATAYPVNANEYVLYVSFAGDDNYRPASNYFDETFRIIPRDIIVKPVLSENIVAGWYMGSSSSSSNDNQKVLDHSKAVIEGYIEADAEAFDYKDSVYNIKAFLSDMSVKVTDKNDEGFTSTNDRYLRTGKEYRIAYKNIKLDPNVLSDRYEGNYNIISESVKFQPNKRGNADVYSSNYYVSSNNNSETIEEIKLSVKKSDLSVEIKPLEGISYYYGTSMAKDINKEELKPGNYFVLNIGKPIEFRAQSDYAVNVNAIYKNSIEKAGGYVLYEHKDYILVAIDAAPLKTGENIRKFDIIWEDGYTESFTVDLREAQLEADLTTAKVPKSLSFNRVNSKMIVGENQQLDVKLTKYIIDDVICLNYNVVSGQDIVSVTNTGYVTALKKGTATIEVYPVKYDNKGNEIRLEFKSVKTKLTVSDVTAPKINKVYAYDTYTDITYTKPSDGYRREIYILEGKGYKPNDFETKIANMSQGSFEGIKIDYVTEYDSYYSLYDYSKNQVTYTVTGLKPNTDYTVYVRNVSGIRTNAQDDYVTASKAGSVKSFKTTKAQIYNLGLYFDNSQQIVYNADLDREEASLSKNKIKVSARGYFDYRPENVAADETDGVVYNLPLDKKQQNTYLNPKLSYYVVEDTDYISGSEYDEMKEFLKLYYTTDFVQIGDRYYTPSSIAKIDKKGNIKLNGTGYIYIIAYDNARKIISEMM